MIEVSLLTFAFGSGVAAFFNPCGVAMLPGYVVYVVGREGADDSRLQATARGAYFGGLASLGFLVVFILFGTIVAAVGSTIVGPWLPWLSLVLALGVIGLGIGMILGRKISFRVPWFETQQGGALGILLYGIAFALISLGCTLPLFLTLIIGSLAQFSALQSVLMFVMYALGMAALMIPVSMISVVARESMQAGIKRVMPYVPVVGGSLIIIIGIYLVWRQVTFFQLL